MGTRNLTCVQKDGELVVAKYCQWDGYPKGQGKIIIDFIAKKFDKKLFISKLANVKTISEKKLKSLWEKCGANSNSEFVSLDVSDKFAKQYPHLHRDMGGTVLAFIQDSDGEVLLQNDKEFAKDSLFCEYAYVLNLDTDSLDICNGFQKENPADSIFYNSKKYRPTKKKGDGSVYYPIGFLMSIPFSSIKKNGVAKTIKQIEKKEKKDD